MRRVDESWPWAARMSWTVVLLALAGAGCDSSAKSEDNVTMREVERPATARAQADTVLNALELTGTLAADESSRVTPLVAGRVVEVPVERGTRVEEGDTLVRLRDTDFRLQVQAARAAVTQAEARLGIEGNEPPPPEDTAEVQAALAQLQVADEQYQRAQALAESGAIAPSALDEARARSDTARAQHRSAVQAARAATAALSSARTQLQQASTALGEVVVRAPFSGEIADKHIAVGEFVSVQSPLVTLVRTDPLRLELEIPQENLLDVAPGQEVEIRVGPSAATTDEATPTTFEGTVRFVSPALDPASRSLTAEAIVPNSEQRLRPGMFVEARVDLGGTRPVVRIPKSAVLTSAGVSRVFVVEGSTIHERVVTILREDGEDVLIDNGLEADDEVATEGLGRLFDGAVIAGGSNASAER